VLVPERPFGEREIAAPDTSTTHVTSSGHAALHAFALISLLEDMPNRFMVAVESPLMRELTVPSSEDVRIQEKLVLPRHSEMLRIGLIP